MRGRVRARVRACVRACTFKHEFKPGRERRRGPAAEPHHMAEMFSADVQLSEMKMENMAPGERRL